MKAKIGRNQVYKEQMQILKAFTSDFVSCFCETFLSGRKKGLIFSKLHPQLVSKLTDLISDVDSKLSIRNHLALAPFTYIQLEAVDHIEADNKMWFETVVKQEYDNLSQFVMKTMLDLC